MEDSVKNIGHLGLISGICKELKLKERVDKIIGSKSPDQKVTMGERLMALVLNGLGFSESRLYLMSEYFEDKPTEELIGPGVTAKLLNDDCLGRLLDKIAEYGASEFFAEIVLPIAHEYNLLKKTVHHDSTSFKLHGEYKPGLLDLTETRLGIVEICHGHSKDHRSDLKQIMLAMTTVGEEGIPIFIEPQSGNTSDKKSFSITLKNMQKYAKKLNIDFKPIEICDSALYSKEFIQLAKKEGRKWLTRVPETSKESISYIEEVVFESDWIELGEGYKGIEKNIIIEGVEQRWCLVNSKQAYRKELHTLERNVEKEKTAIKKVLNAVSKIKFDCQLDAQKALDLEFRKFKYHKKGATNLMIIDKPPKTEMHYKITCSFETDLEKIESKKVSLGRFILATNVDKEELKTEEILKEYKGLSSVEKGFRCLKDPWFHASTLFLKSPKRLTALTCVMSLSLFIYTFGELKLRKHIPKLKKTILSKAGKPLKTLTMRRVFQIFKTISIITINYKGKILKRMKELTKIQKEVLHIFGPFYENIYQSMVNT